MGSNRTVEKETKEKWHDRKPHPLNLIFIVAGWDKISVKMQNSVMVLLVAAWKNMGCYHISVYMSAGALIHVIVCQQWDR